MGIVVGAFEAKTKLAELLDKVESGDIVTITRRGKAVAYLQAGGFDPIWRALRAGTYRGQGRRAGAEGEVSPRHGLRLHIMQPRERVTRRAN